MRSWIDNHGSKYGWRKTEAMGEWWHVNFVAGVWSPPPNPLRFLNRTQRAKAEKLLYHRRQADQELQSGKGPRYRRQVKWRDHYRAAVLKEYRRAGGRQKRVLRRVLKDRDGSV